MKTPLFSRCLAALAFATPALASTCLSGDCENGVGKRVYPEHGNATYEGHFKNGQWEGQGTLVVPGRSSYTGTFANSVATGVGTLAFPSGDRYQGSVVAGEMHGEGVYTFASGETLAGTFKHGQIWSGQGYFPISEGIYYRGQFANGAFHGEGEARFADGSYKGSWANGKRHGQGKFSGPDGALQYDGHWENDTPKPDHFPFFKQALERPFKGISALTLYDQTGGLKRSFHLRLEPSYKLSGTISSTIVVERRPYTSTLVVKGSFDPATNTVRFQSEGIFHQDTLPPEIQWIEEPGFTVLTLLNDLDHPGHFVLQGHTPKGEPLKLSSYP